MLRNIKVFGLLSILLTAGIGASWADTVDDWLKAYPTKRGVACLPDCGEGELVLELASRSEFLILALDPDEAKIAVAKRKAAEAGVLGRSLYIEQGSLKALPFADNYVDLLALPNKSKADLTEAEQAEIMRVLTPIHGKAFLKDQVIEKPELPGSDWWAHKLHGPNNNQVSKDTVFQWPPLLQYRAMPYHNAHTGSGLTSNACYVEIHDWTIKNPERAYLAGRLYVRNSYNGRILWQAHIPKNIESNMPLFAAADSLLFMASGTRADVHVRDLLSGEEKASISLSGEDRRVKWLAVEDGTLYALLGDPMDVRTAYKFLIQPAIFSQQEEKNTLFGDQLIAWDLSGGKERWSWRESDVIDFRAVAVEKGRVYFFSEQKYMACLDGTNGQLLWKNNDEAWMAEIKRPAKIKNHNIRHMSTLSVADGLVRLALMEASHSFLFNDKDGTLFTTIDEGRWWGAQKAFILDGKYFRGGTSVDLQTGERTEESLSAPIGLAWCGIATYAPGMGALGHSTLGFKSPCGVGAWVAGGILLYGPTVCGCGALQGAAGFASGEALLKRIETAPEHPLVKGLAFGKESNLLVEKDAEKSWPAYRGDSRHRGSSPVDVGQVAKLQWIAVPKKPFAFTPLYNQFVEVLDERPSAPIVVGDLIFSAGTDGIVRANRLIDGSEAWEFFADGPVFSSPAYEAGRLFVPCLDGWVYALDAATGELAWRRRVAPMERRIHVFDQLISTWPVLSLAAQDGVVYSAAGMLKMNGSVALALDTQTGDIVWSNNFPPEVDGSHWPTQKRVFGYNGQTAIAGEHVWMAGHLSMPLTLDRKTGALPPLDEKYETMRIRGYNTFKAIYYSNGENVIVIDEKTVLTGGSHIIENRHLREGKRMRIDFNLYSLDERGAPDMDQPPPSILKVARIAPAVDDELMVFAAPPPTELDGKGNERDNYKTSLSTVGLNVWKTSAFVEEGRKMIAKPLVDEAGSKGARVAYNKAIFRNFNYGNAFWQKPEIDVSAVALASNAVLVAHAVGFQEPYGWKLSEETSQKPLILYEGWKLTAFKRESGEEIWSVELPTEPLQNAIAIASDGTVLVTLRDGSMVAVKGAK